MSLGELLAGSRPDISGTTSVTLDDYVAQILASGFPGMRWLTEADVRHLRTHRGEREIDFIVIGPDAGIVAVEVKLAATVDADDTKHLRWLKARIGDRLMDAVIVTTGTDAYRREDGIAVVPAALLGP